MDSHVTTFVLETLNFLVLMAILQRLVYRPLRDAIASRREENARTREETDREREEARALRAEWEEKHRELTSLRSDVRREALEDAVKERARLLEQAHADAAQERSRVQRLLASERQAAEDWVRSMAIERGTELAGRMLLALAPDHVDRILRERLLETLRTSMDELARELRALDAVDVEITGARLIDEPFARTVRQLVEPLVTSPVRITAVEDEGLLAGAIVRVGDVVFDGSIRGQLEAFRSLAEAIDGEAPGSTAASSLVEPALGEGLPHG